MFDHLQGQFAFCIWDSRTNEVVLARDRAGICPLFYTVVKHDGTELAPVRLRDEGAVRLRARRAQGGHPGPEPHLHVLRDARPHDGLRRASSASRRAATCTSSSVAASRPKHATRQKTYWQVTYPDRGHEDYGADEKRVVDEFEAVLFQGVQRRLRTPTCRWFRTSPAASIRA